MFDGGDLEIESNEKFFQELSWYSHYVLYVINSEIIKSLKYINLFEDVFKKNHKILVFNKNDQVTNVEFFNQNTKIKKFINKNKIKNIFLVNFINKDSVDEFKNKLFKIIQDDIINKIFKGIKESDFEKNPILFHKEIFDSQNKIGS